MDPRVRASGSDTSPPRTLAVFPSIFAEQRLLAGSLWLPCRCVSAPDGWLWLFRVLREKGSGCRSGLLPGRAIGGAILGAARPSWSVRSDRAGAGSNKPTRRRVCGVSRRPGESFLPTIAGLLLSVAVNAICLGVSCHGRGHLRYGNWALARSDTGKSFFSLSSCLICATEGAPVAVRRLLLGLANSKFPCTEDGDYCSADGTTCGNGEPAIQARCSIAHHTVRPARRFVLGRPCIYNSIDSCCL